MISYVCLQEQVQWAIDGGCDYIIAETFCYLGEALIALDVIKKAGTKTVSSVDCQNRTIH
jgi:betaine-homocysteine S-methyltransferase